MRGRKPKPAMTEAEFCTIVPVLVQKTGKHGGSLERAAWEISKARGAHDATDPRTKRLRAVSARWVLRQLQARAIPGKKGMQAKYGNSQGPQQLRQNPGEGDYSGSSLVTKSSSVAQIAPFNDGVHKSDEQPGGNLGEQT